MKRILLSAFAVMVVSGAAQAALFSGASSFTYGPVSQLGTLTNNLVLTDNANGFVVSGQLLINVPAGYVAGTLASWTVDRPLDPTYGTGSLITTTSLSGFSQPPVGTFGNTSGVVESYFTNYPVTSLSQIPLSLTAGAATWSSLSVNSSTFTYVSGGTNYLHQRFDLDGIQISGPGGTWIVDVPVTTIATVVPEPMSTTLMGLGLSIVVLWRRIRR